MDKKTEQTIIENEVIEEYPSYNLVVILLSIISGITYTAAIGVCISLVINPEIFEHSKFPIVFVACCWWGLFVVGTMFYGFVTIIQLLKEIRDK